MPRLHVEYDSGDPRIKYGEIVYLFIVYRVLAQVFEFFCVVFVLNTLVV